MVGPATIPPPVPGTVAPPSGGDWGLIETYAPMAGTLTGNKGLDESVHQINPWGQLPTVQAWIENFMITAAGQGKNVYYIGVWGSRALSKYDIICWTDR